MRVKRTVRFCQLPRSAAKLGISWVVLVHCILGAELDGVEVGCRGSVGVSVGNGDTVGGSEVGEFVGFIVGALVGSVVMSNALHPTPP